MGKIKTESGVWIPATYKSNRYEQWKEKNKTDYLEEEQDESPKQRSTVNLKTHWARHNVKLREKQKRSELKTTDQIMKARKLAEKKKQRNKRKKGKGRKK